MTSVFPYSTPQDLQYLSAAVPMPVGPEVRPTSLYGIFVAEYPYVAEWMMKAGIAGELNDIQANRTLFIDPLFRPSDRETARRTARACSIDGLVSSHILRSSPIMNLQSRNDYMRVCFETLPNGKSLFGCCPNTCEVVQFDMLADNGVFHVLKPGTLYANMFTSC